MSFSLGLLSRVNVSFYRLTSGRVGGHWSKAGILLLTTAGSKSGKRRTNPVLFLRDGDDLVVVAPHGGRDRNPSWWINLKQNPGAVVQIGEGKMSVRAAEASMEDKTRLWPLLVEMHPTYDDYQNKTKRVILVGILRPLDPATHWGLARSTS